MANTKVVTGKVRFSYCNIFEPREPQGGGDPKYSVTLLIPKSDTATLNKIKQATPDAREAFCNRNGANALPAKPNHTLHDGDGERPNGGEFGEECKGCYVITVSSRQNAPLPVAPSSTKRTRWETPSARLSTAFWAKAARTAYKTNSANALRITLICFAPPPGKCCA